jgi:hypothetical protein
MFNNLYVYIKLLSLNMKQIVWYFTSLVNYDT